MLLLTKIGSDLQTESVKVALENPLTHGAHRAFLRRTILFGTKTRRRSTLNGLDSLVTVGPTSLSRRRNTRRRLLDSRLDDRVNEY